MQAEESATPMTPIRRGAVASWILYDLANTIFSFVVLSFYFGPWVTDDLGRRDSWVTVTESLSMALVILFAPLLGAAADRTRKIPFLTVSTFVAVAATVLLGLGAWLGLEPRAAVLLAAAFFFVGNVGYQLGLVFYDALLPVVTTRETIGRIGALGVSIGYLGSVVGLGIGTVVLLRNPDGEPLLFALAGAAFLAFALPALLFIRERPGRGVPAGRTLRQEAFASTMATLRKLPGEKAMARFLVGRWLYSDAANTVILILGIFAVKEAGFEAETTDYTILLGLGIVAAIAAAPLWGRLVDRNGPVPTLQAVLLLWFATLLFTALHPVLGLDRPLFYVYGALVGVCLGGTWSCDRPILVGLAPRESVGEWFGLYALAGRFAAITGPLLYSAIVDLLLPDAPYRRSLGMVALAVMVMASFLILRKLEDPYKPGARPFARVVPWGDGSGLATPPYAKFPQRAVVLLAYLVLSWVLFLPFAVPVSGDSGFYSLPAGFRSEWTYAIPDLTRDAAHVFVTFFTAPMLNHDLIQLVYVTFLLLAFGVVFEIKEGWRRALLVFLGGGFVGALVAGILLTLLHPNVDHPLLEEAWARTWSGGSAGAFALMGAFAARAQRPWLFLSIFAVWEINVGYWFLRSYTPAFHLTALAFGYWVTRHALKPIPAAAAAAVPATAHV